MIKNSEIVTTIWNTHEVINYSYNNINKIE